MAIIGDIRRNPWILIVFIALGLAGFIFMDSTSGERSLFGGQQTSIGEIDGVAVDQRKFNGMESSIYAGSTADPFVRRSALWNYFVEEALVNKEVDAIGGINVGNTELQNLVFGNNGQVSPLISARFRNPQTGAVDFQQLNEIKTRLQNRDATDTNLPNLETYWKYQDEEVRKDRKQSKINALISKGIFTPSWEVSMLHKEQNQQAEFAYVRIPYGDIEDVTLTDADFKAYIKENAATLKRDEETRRIEYVSFDIIPSVQDTADILAKLVGLRNDMSADGVDDATFFARNLGVLDAAYLERDQIASNVADALFGQEAGTTYGPYLEGNSYRVAKLIDQKVIPDSVRSRHILLRVNTPIEAQSADARIDSMIVELEAGRATFEALAEQFGTDGTSSTGGDLGYTFPGGMVKPFSDLIFYEAERGELHKVVTQYGIHLVEVTGKKFITQKQGARIAYVSETIVPSEATQSASYDEAYAFVEANRTIEDLRAAAGSLGLSTETSTALAQNDYTIGSLGVSQSSREMVRFAFDGSTNIGDVSSEIYIFQDPITRYNNKHVIAALLSEQEAGVPSVDNIRSDIENQVRNAKKADELIGKITSTDLGSIASTYDAVIDTASNVSFGSGFASGLGNEPAVIGAALTLESGATSGPIEGSNGVYIVKLLSKSEVTSEPNVATVRRTNSSSLGLQVTSALMQSMRKDAKIVDSRSRFF